MTQRNNTLTGAAAVRNENEWRAVVGLTPYSINHDTIALVERRNIASRIAELAAAKKEKHA